MTTEPKRIELHVDSDLRLAAAVGAAVRHLAETAGLPEEVSLEFQKEALEATKKLFSAQSTKKHVVDLLVYSDRLEVVLDGGSGSGAVRLTRSLVSQR